MSTTIGCNGERWPNKINVQCSVYSKLGECAYSFGGYDRYGTTDDEVTLVEADVLSITATAPDKDESNALSVTVAAALAPTKSPEVEGTVRAGDDMISGTTDADAFVCVMRDETVIGKATADGTGAYTVTLNDGVTLGKDEVLSIIAKAPDKSISETVSVIVDDALTRTIELTEPQATTETTDPQTTTEAL